MVAIPQDPLMQAALQHSRTVRATKGSAVGDAHLAQNPFNRSETPPPMTSSNSSHDADSPSSISETSATDNLIRTSPSAPCRDRVFRRWLDVNFSPRQTQILENYHDFRMGQGDPLLLEITRQHQSAYRRISASSLPCAPFLEVEGQDGTENDTAAAIKDNATRAMPTTKMESPIAHTAFSFLQDVIHIGKEIMGIPTTPPTAQTAEGTAKTTSK
mmetsp:Transcript_15931/g.44049  ORF Transcript_15931/g.44049 Transcript_15931/m.44049 type:complete len:215 (+) Transcript_15931:118-762(+)